MVAPWFLCFSGSSLFSVQSIGSLGSRSGAHLLPLPSSASSPSSPPPARAFNRWGETGKKLALRPFFHLAKLLTFKFIYVVNYLCKYLLIAWLPL